MKCIILLFFLWLSTLSSSLFASSTENNTAEKKLVFSISGLSEKTDLFKRSQRMLDIISAKIGYDIELINPPFRRGKHMLIKGLIDADVGRSRNYYTPDETIRINEVTFTLPFYAFSKRDDIDTKDTDSLRKLRIVARRGLLFVEKFFEGSDVIYVDTLKSGFLFIHKGRADIFVTDGFSLLPLLESFNPGDLDIKRLTPPIATTPLYTFFHKSKADIARKFEAALIETKKEGTYFKILYGKEPAQTKPESDSLTKKNETLQKGNTPHNSKEQSTVE